MARFAHGYLQTKRMSKHANKKLPFGIRYVPDEYRAQPMCNKVVIQNDGTLKFVPDKHEPQKMCNQAVDNYVDALE